jgi:hypothetical protein
MFDLRNCHDEQIAHLASSHHSELSPVETLSHYGAAVSISNVSYVSIYVKIYNDVGSQ